jgi:hypothetical protein
MSPCFRLPSENANDPTAHFSALYVGECNGVASILKILTQAARE